MPLMIRLASALMLLHLSSSRRMSRDPWDQSSRFNFFSRPTVSSKGLSSSSKQFY